MLSTIILFAVIIGGLIGSVSLWAFFLRLGLRWAKVDGVTTGRVVLTTAVVMAIQLAVNLLLHLPSLASAAFIG